MASSMRGTVFGLLAKSNGTTLASNVSAFMNNVSRFISTSNPCLAYYVKKTYLKKWGRRDQKRRQLYAEHEDERNALRVIKKSDILPMSIKTKAGEDLAALPLNSCITRMRDRCTLTDRSRGVVVKYRISRMEFREFADKGLISGYTRSSW
eukprot:Seg9250.2 transcript_id=Seg9250.2/GoldUCD/mRNA.D3Y31 product="28S ribosomal protein S14 mitochondrial" pseudo=true protein_id=Seg9250.2/GoldUCD/D3Y31